MMFQDRSWFSLLLIVCAGFVGGFVAQFFGGAKEAGAQLPSQKAIVAGELRLADETGRTRLLLTLVRNKPRLFMLDEDGEYRLEMGLGDTGEPHIWLRDQDGASKVQVALTAKGLPSFRLADQKGRDRAILALSQNGDPTLLLRDSEGHDRVALWRDQKEEGLALADEKGRPLAALSVRDKGKPSLTYFEGDLSYQSYR